MKHCVDHVSSVQLRRCVRVLRAMISWRRFGDSWRCMASQAAESLPSRRNDRPLSHPSNPLNPLITYHQNVHNFTSVVQRVSTFFKPGNWKTGLKFNAVAFVRFFGLDLGFLEGPTWWVVFFALYGFLAYRRLASVTVELLAWLSSVCSFVRPSSVADVLWLNGRS